MRVIHRAAATAVVAALALVLVACDPAPTRTVGPGPGRRLAGPASSAPTTCSPASFDPSLDDLGGSAYSASNLMAVGHRPRPGPGGGRRRCPDRVDEYTVDTNGDDLPGSLARLIIAVESVGRNPRSFGGEDLVARLEATVRPSGLFGVQDADLRRRLPPGPRPWPRCPWCARSRPPSSPATARSGTGRSSRWLRGQQCADGSWMPFRDDLTEPCAFDPVTFSGPDTNSAALASLGLAAVGAKAKIDPERLVRRGAGDRRRLVLRRRRGHRVRPGLHRPGAGRP